VRIQKKNQHLDFQIEPSIKRLVDKPDEVLDEDLDEEERQHIGSTDL
jgi:hypothetical protein